MTPRVGDRVRVERDETRYPSSGTWPQFRGKTGTVVEVNLGEYGVVFSKAVPRTDGRGAFRYSGAPTWFKSHELVGSGPEAARGSSVQAPAMAGAR